MVDLKKILRQAFGKTSLQNEDWLEPSGDMLEQIEARIYTKKKGRGWLFLLPLFVLFLTIFGVHYLSNLAPSPSIAEVVSTPSHSMETKAEGTATPEIISSEVMEKNLSSVDETALVNKPENNASVASKNPNSTDQKKTETPVENFTLGQNKLFDEQPLTTTKKVIKGADSSIVSLSEKVDNNNRPNGSEITLTLKDQVALNPLDAPDLLLFSSTLANRKAPAIKVILPKKSTWSLAAGTGISYWQFKLNDTYRSALAPADFQSSNGVGFRTFVGLNKQLGGRFSLKANLAYENIGFSSGHNSSLDYDRTAETDTDHSNTKMVGMATPIGFIESDLVINRNSESAGSELLIDIKNQHRIQSLDLVLTLDYELPEFLGFTPMLSAGAGVQYINKISNELKSFTPQQSDFSAGKGEIVADQKSLQRWSPTMTTGLRLEKRINKNISFGLNGNYLFNLSALQKMDGFSTNLNRFNGGIYLRRNF